MDHSTNSRGCRLERFKNKNHIWVLWFVKIISGSCFDLTRFFISFFNNLSISNAVQEMYFTIENDSLTIPLPYKRRISIVLNLVILFSVFYISSFFSILSYFPYFALNVRYCGLLLFSPKMSSYFSIMSRSAQILPLITYFPATVLLRSSVFFLYLQML